MNIGNTKKFLQKTILVAFIAVSFYAAAQPPTGYYNNAIGKSCATLKTALKSIITTGNNPKSYSDLWVQYPISDIKPRTVGTGSANVIYDIYSSVPGGTDPYQFTPSTNQCGTYNSEADCYNREHSVPLSWFNGSTGSNGPATDYLHIYPTDGHVNGKRASFIYGEVATANFTSLNGSKLGSSANAGFTGNVFEPVDSFKGDVARSFLYFVTRYENDVTTFATNVDAAQSFDASTFPSIKINYLKLMIKWHKLDPVSTKEKTRNNAAYSFQGNRNPFIDRPEYVDSVWNGGCPGLSVLPVNFVVFKGKVNNNLLDLNWQVSNEVNVLKYDLEFSVNGTSFSTIASIEAHQAANYSYSVNVNDIKGKRVYYRVKNVDKNGKYTYSELFTIHIPLNTRFTVYPNPAGNFINVQVNDYSISSSQITITDITGKVVLQKKIAVQNGLAVIDASSLSNGTYFIQLKTNNEWLTSKLVILK
ncbi:MAG: endonuclease [Bacteroidetes bacterium]|nr:endonuclease [Bacteroidota bacterium]